MKHYAARGGDSGVVAYDDVAGGIAVQFHGGKVYLYTQASVGATHLARLRAAATRGQGLATYISRHVHDRYEELFDTQAAWQSGKR